MDELLGYMGTVTIWLAVLFVFVGHFNCVYCGDLMSLPELNRVECKGKD